MPDGRDASRPHDASTRPVDATRPVDPTVDAGTIPDDWVPLTPEQADCFGLTDPGCAGCHVAPGSDQWVLRPGFAPAPPPDLVIEPGDCH